MRNMSFAATTMAILVKEKTVTRRLRWQFLKVGDQIQPVRKAQGLRKGEKVEPLGGPITVVAVSRERLDSIGPYEVMREGFAGQNPLWFVEMFRALNHCAADAEVTRIEFEYS